MPITCLRLSIASATSTVPVDKRIRKNWGSLLVAISIRNHLRHLTSSYRGWGEFHSDAILTVPFIIGLAPSKEVYLSLCLKIACPGKIMILNIANKAKYRLRMKRMLTITIIHYYMWCELPFWMTYRASSSFARYILSRLALQWSGTCCELPKETHLAGKCEEMIKSQHWERYV